MRDKTRIASKMADSSDEKESAAGFSMISEILATCPRRDMEFGFFDNALFLARKHASSGAPEVRDAVAGMLAAMGRVVPELREAVEEAIDEIKMQRSAESHSVAAKALESLGG
ncbi:MAG: hypothetical protein LBQ36_01185 [Synergistaceae bacterium]|jgi:hypothetical protein|nr:hypothetical protein [Synergistaceae bacterium]